MGSAKFEGYMSNCLNIANIDNLPILVPGAAVTKSPPPVVFCQVGGVSHIYVTESQPPVIFMPTQVSHICSGGGDFRKLQ